MIKNRSNKKKNYFNLTVFTGVMSFLYIPLIILIIYSFNNSKIVTGWKGFTFKYYFELLKNEEILSAFWNTLEIGVLSTLISTTIGLFAAMAMENKRFTGRKYLTGLIFLPLIMPDILMGVSLALLYNFMQLGMGMSTVLIAHITFCISYTVIVINSRLDGFDYSLEEAAMDLGANRWQIFYKIKFPLIMPGLVAAALLAFTLSIDDFIITFFTTGRGFKTLPIYVEGAIRRGTITTINALSTLMIGMTFMFAVITKRFRKLMLG